MITRHSTSLAQASSKELRRLIHQFNAFKASFVVYAPRLALYQVSQALASYLRSRLDGTHHLDALRAAHCAENPLDAQEFVDRLEAWWTAIPGEPGVDESDELQYDGIIAARLSHRPRNLMLLLTEHCNLSCRYCYQHGILREGPSNGKPSPASQTTRHGDFGQLAAAIDAYLGRTRERKNVSITFFGGEPLLKFAMLRDLVEYADERSHLLGKSLSYSITTNGTLLSEEVVRFLVDRRFAVMCSMDGPANIQDANRPGRDGRGSFEVVRHGVRRLLEAQLSRGTPPLIVRSTLTSVQAAKGGRDAVHAYFAQEFPGARVMIGSADWENDRDNKPSPFDASAYTTLLAQLDTVTLEDFAIGGRFEEIADAMTRMQDAMQSGAGPIRCGVGTNMVAASPDGQLYPCHRYAGMSAFALGRATAGVEMELHKAFLKKVLAIYEEHCGTCWARVLCGGECPHTLSRQDGTLGVPDERKCNAWRSAWELQLACYWLFRVERPDLFGLLFEKNSSGVETCGNI